MTKYIVMWLVEREASSPSEAASFALEIQEQSANTAKTFAVVAADRADTPDSGVCLVDRSIDGDPTTNTHCYAFLGDLPVIGPRQ